MKRAKQMMVMTGMALLSATTAQLSMAQTEKKPLDITACMAWKRVDAPDISPTGRWVTYRIVPMEPGEGKREPAALHLYDTHTGKDVQLPGIEQLYFYHGDRAAFYQQTDSTGQEKTVLLSLSSGEKKEWPYEEPFHPVEGTGCSFSVTRIPADTTNHVPAFSRLTVRRLDTGSAFRIDSIGYYTLYNKQRSILFVRQRSEGGNELCFGPLAGPHRTLFRASAGRGPSSFSFDAGKQTGSFVVDDSLWYDFSLKENRCRLVFDRKEIAVPDGMEVVSADLAQGRSFLTLRLRPTRQPVVAERKKEAPEEGFELELWTWDEYEVPTLQSRRPYHRPEYPKYIYDIAAGRLTEAAPAHAELLAPDRAAAVRHVLYTDDTPYRMQKEWLDRVPFDVWSTDLHTGRRQLVAHALRTSPKWSPNGRWAVMYDPQARVWSRFDGLTGTLSDLSSAIGHPVFNEEYDKPAPAPPYGIAGWTTDGNGLFLYDAYDWWKIDLTGERQPECLTRGYGRSGRKIIRKLSSNIDREVFDPDEKVMVNVCDTRTMNEQVCLLDLKSGRLEVLMEGPYHYTVHRFSDDRKSCVWMRQNVSEFRDLWWSRADFARPVRITTANPQQSLYRWADARLVEWTNREGRPFRGVLYLPEDYDASREYPVLVQFYETHTEELNTYPAPLLSSAMADVMYFVSNGYLVFMPDVHFTVGAPGPSSYEAVVGGTEHLIAEGVARPGKIGLQGHSWSGFQAAYLLTKTDMFTCACIGAPITDMVTGYLGIRAGSGLPRYFMYEEAQSRMGKTLWDAREAYLNHSVLLEADRIHTPFLLCHNDQDEAVAYEQGRALYLAMRRLQRPAWLLNYKGEGHFIGALAARKDWTIRMKQFFDYYLTGTPEPRWMKEGIHLSERSTDLKYDFTDKQ